jgi:multidrug efflux pump subunit AcrA (membrane-fusion protein)
MPGGNIDNHSINSPLTTEAASDSPTTSASINELKALVASLTSVLSSMQSKHDSAIATMQAQQEATIAAMQAKQDDQSKQLAQLMSMLMASGILDQGLSRASSSALVTTDLNPPNVPPASPERVRK